MQRHLFLILLLILAWKYCPLYPAFWSCFSYEYECTRLASWAAGVSFYGFHVLICAFCLSREACGRVLATVVSRVGSLVVSSGNFSSSNCYAYRASVNETGSEASASIFDKKRADRM